MIQDIFQYFVSTIQDIFSMTRNIGTFEIEITVTGEFGTSIREAGRSRAAVVPLRADYFSRVTISFPGRRPHLAVATLVRAAMTGRWSAGMAFETTEWKCELLLQ
jgi:hypothetical protein